MAQEVASRYADQFLQDLHQMWKPHTGQLPLGRAVFRDRKKISFGQCGRSWGKTEFALYAAWRKAGTTRDTPIYLVAPWYKQAREIYFASGRLPNFGPKKYIKKVYRHEARVVFQDNSFIKLEGSDNPDIHRGIIAGFLVFDEFKDFHPLFWPAMRPNLLKYKDWQILAIGTPPENDVTDAQRCYINLVEECQSQERNFWCRSPASDNPHIDLQELETIKQILIARGEEDVWQREYEGLFVKGGKNAIFPMFSEAEHVFDHKDLMVEVEARRGAIEWHTIADPGTRVCFGQLFIGHDKETGNVFVLDELYEKDQGRNTVDLMFKQEQAIITEFFPHPEDWMYTYDEAALWFANERSSQEDFFHDGRQHGWMPTSKGRMASQVGELKPGLAIVKDMLLYKKLKISRRCKNLIWEIKSYIKDETGQIPKANDHLLDPLRYFIFRSGYTLGDVRKLDLKQRRRQHILGSVYNRSTDSLPSEGETMVESDAYWGNPYGEDFFLAEDESW